MQELLTQVQSVVQNNQVLATITSGSLVVWLVTNLKGIWSGFVNAVLLFISFRIENFYEDNRSNDGYISTQQNVFNEIISNSKAIFERTRNMDLSQSVRYDDDFDNMKRKYNSISQASLTFGFSMRIINGKLVFCNRTMNTGGQKTMISTSLRVFFANKERFVKTLEDTICKNISERIKEREKGSTINVYNGFAEFGKKTKRKLNSIFTKDNCHIGLYEDIKRFLESKSVYDEMNYPYKFCALLYGKPGTGKTSTILSIASELNCDIRYISMSNLNVQELISAINGSYGGGRRVIFVIEDIDAVDAKANSNRDDDDGKNGICSGKKEEVSLSDLLNVTDGLLSSDGLILLFTTNHIERLDEAFLRSGRMNSRVEFDYLDSGTASRMVEYHLGRKVENLSDGIKPTELQEEILGVKTGKSTLESLEKKFSKAMRKNSRARPARVQPGPRFANHENG